MTNFRQVQRKFRRTFNLDPDRAIVGDSSGRIKDPTIVGNVLVRRVTSNGPSTAISVGAPANNIKLSVGDPVILETAYGKLRIKEIDNDSDSQRGNDPSDRIFESDYITQMDIATLRPRQTATASLTVNFGAWAPIVNNTYRQENGYQADYTSFIPTAGNMRVVTAFLKPDFTIELKGSTSRSMADVDLGSSDIQENLTAKTKGSLPIWSIFLSDNPSTITQAMIDAGVDHRQFLNTNDNRIITTTADPTVNDDSGDGYGVGDIWINTTDDQVWMLTNATAGAAVWEELTTPGSGGGSGDVTGPASSTDNAIARFDGITGKIIQDSAVTISDTGAITQISGSNNLQIAVPALTGNRTATWQDASGTIAYTADITAATALAVILAPGTTARNTITPTGTGIVPLTLNLPSGSSSNIQEWQSNATVIGSLGSTGLLALSGTGASETITNSSNSGIASLSTINNGTATVFFRVFGSAFGGTFMGLTRNNMAELGTNSGVSSLVIDCSSGPILFGKNGTEFARFDNTNGNFALNVLATGSAKLHVQGAASGKVAIFQANATTPGNLTEWQTSAGTLRFAVGAEQVASAAGATLRSLYGAAQTITITGSTNITTATGFNLVEFGQPTLSAANALTITNAATVYIANSPTGGGAGPAAITNAYALWVDAGVVRIDGNINLSNAAVNVILDSTTGTQWGTATGQKQSWWGATPVVQQVLATGAGRTVDDVISFLQTVGLCKQS